MSERDTILTRVVSTKHGKSDVFVKPDDILPSNYRVVKSQMIALARRNNTVEVGGVMLTNQQDIVHWLFVGIGNHKTISVPFPDPSCINQTLNTLVAFHSHPSGKTDHSPEDHHFFREMVSRIQTYFDLNCIDSNCFLYNFVVTPKGRVTWLAAAITMGENQSLFPFKKVWQQR